MVEHLSALNLDGIPDAPVSRLAPTPSGFLHLGNAVNFLVTWALVRHRKGHLHLRIDDMDGIRFRQDVLESIFQELDWLGLDWDTGPQSPDEFHRDFSLQARRDVYMGGLEQLMAEGHAFACTCSRRMIKAASTNGLYPGTCRSAGHALEPGQNAVRLTVPSDARVRVGETGFDLGGTFGDFVLWRRDDQPSYQLASLMEDEAAGSNFIVRGADLLPSTAAQLYLADCFGYKRFPACTFLHHGLVMGGDGEKLSKSRGAYALKDMRESGLGPESAFRAAARVLGVAGHDVGSARDLVLALG